MLGDVSLLQQRMQFRLKEYKTLVQMGLALFKNLAEVEAMIEVVDRKQMVYKTTAIFYTVNSRCSKLNNTFFFYKDVCYSES